MKLISGAGKRVNNSRSSRSSHTQHRHSTPAAAQNRSRTPVWEDDETRIVREDGSSYAASYSPKVHSYQQPKPVARSYEQAEHHESDDYTPPHSYSHYQTKDSRRRDEKRRKTRKRLVGFSAALVAMAGLYLFCVYTNIPFVEKWRNIYIETALMTRTHQWLATALIPKPVVDEVRDMMTAAENAQNDVESDWSNSAPLSTMELPAIVKPGTDTEDPNGETTDEPQEETPFWLDPWSEFCLTYQELDMESFAAYAEEHEDEMFDENGNLFIDEAGLDQEGTSIKTIHGDQVLALDTIHGITLVRLEDTLDTGPYKGVMAIIKDPSMVGVATAKRLGIVGQKIAGIAEDNDAILAINASGFEDPDGYGNGGIVYGLLYAGGEKLEGTDGGNYKVGYFDYDNRFHVGTWKSTKDIRDGVEFKPALVVNGDRKVEGTAGWGIHPRTAIGQTEDGTVIFVVIDGRSTESIGITVTDMADIMMKYGVTQALNLDGGSSSIMWWNGRKITNPSGGDKENGRYLPDAFVVYANRKATDGLERPE